MVCVSKAKVGEARIVLTTQAAIRRVKLDGARFLSMTPMIAGRGEAMALASTITD
jgi:hypothetical protein